MAEFPFWLAGRSSSTLCRDRAPHPAHSRENLGMGLPPCSWAPSLCAFLFSVWRRNRESSLLSRHLNRSWSVECLAGLQEQLLAYIPAAHPKVFQLFCRKAQRQKWQTTNKQCKTELESTAIFFWASFGNYIKLVSHIKRKPSSIEICPRRYLSV